MEAILNTTSALDYWRHHSESKGCSSFPCGSEPARKGPVRVCTPSAAIASDLASWGLANPDDMQLLVTSADMRRQLKGVSCMVCKGPFPANSFVRTLGQVYVECPELLFVLLAQSLPLVRLLEVGFELCGTYRMVDGSPAYGFEPLTSVARIRSYAPRAGNIRGAGAALSAAQWLLDGSGSPAETALAIVFGLPLRLGGYALGGFQLNAELQLNETAARLLGRDTIRPDLYWEKAKHPAEYDSSCYHSGREQADYDERRRNAYAAMGMSVTVIRSRHIISFGRIDEIACTIRKNIGRKCFHVPSDYEYRKDALLAEAFRYWLELRDDYGTGDDFAVRAASWSAPPSPW